MKKNLIVKLSLTLICWWGMTQGWAQQLSESEALKVAEEFCRKSTPTRRMVPSAGETSLSCAYTAVSSEKSNDYYVFNRGTDAGYVIVSGEGSVPSPVLGYSDEGTFVYEEMPEAMRYWLDGYAEQIQWARTTRTVAVPDEESEQTSSVAPLLGDIAWGQGAPYNLYVPLVDVTGASDWFRAPAGCVATAMAQIMYYYRWPERGTGIYGDTDFSQSVYSWDIMSPVYNSQSSQASQEAVAMLMRDLGTAVKMKYAAGGSSAYDRDAAGALATYFGYDKGLSYKYRSDYGYKAWENMLREEIDAGRPVYYSGGSTSGSHAFVCDGYEGDGYFHFNWGWSGSYNGYFRTSALVLSEVGTGGGGGNYNYSQSVIVGIQPDQGHDVSWSVEVTADDFTSEDGQTFYGPIEATTWYDGEVSVDLGIRIVNMTTEETRYMKSTTLTGTITMTANKLTVDDYELPDGDYRIEPVYRIPTDDVWRVLLASTGKLQVLLSVTDGVKSVVQQNSPTEAELTFSDIRIPGKWVVLENCPITFSLTNTGADFEGELKIRLFSGTEEINTYFLAEIAAVNCNETREINTFFNLEWRGSQDFPVGDYEAELGIYGGQWTNYTPISEHFPVHIISRSFTIDEQNIPCEVLREEIRKSDKNNDGRINDIELKNITTLNLRNLTSSKGLELLAWLSSLYVENSVLGELSLTDNNALTVLRVPNCQLTQLDVSGCPNLEGLDCGYNQLTEIKGIENCRSLKNLSCGNNQFAQLDVSGFAELTYLLASRNQLTELDLSKNPLLNELSCSGNQLTELDLSHNPLLSILYCTDGQLAELDLHAQSGLTELYIGNNQLETLDVNGLPSLVSLECYGNRLETLDISELPVLKKLRCEFNNLSTLNLSDLASLEDLTCGNNYLTTLNLNGLSTLKTLSCDRNELTALDLSGLSALESFSCWYNKIADLKLDGLSSLTGLNCGHNELTVLDVSDLPALEELACYENHLSVLDFSQNAFLRNVSADGNELLFLNLGNLLNLESCYASINRKWVDLGVDGTFDLSPYVAAGMDLSRMSEISGATLDGTSLVITERICNFTYDTGNANVEPITFYVVSDWDTQLAFGISELTMKENEIRTLDVDTDIEVMFWKVSSDNSNAVQPQIMWSEGKFVVEVTAQREGTAVISIEAGSHKTQCTVHVTPATGLHEIESTMPAIDFNGKTISVSGADCVSLQVYGLDGRKRQMTSSEELSLEGLDNGIYIIRAVLVDGRSLTRKVVLK